MKKILLPILVCISFIVCADSTYPPLIGTWKGNYDTTTAILIFNKDHTGSIKWSNSEKIYLFKYFFKNKSILCIYDKSGKNYHQINLTNNRLKLTPYPKALRESIELIDVVTFHRAIPSLSKTD